MNTSVEAALRFHIHLFLYFFFRYDTARGIIDAIFGPKTHNDFPKNRRLKGSGCGNGLYPSYLGGRRQEYKHTGLDLLIEKGDPVCQNIYL